MAEIVIVSSNKESCGMGVVDVATGSMVCNSFKNCIADAGALCTIGSSSSSYSGQGSSGDYIVAAQSKKPVIHIWQWGKSQALMVCHVQEIITSLASDSTGTFLVGGTRKGWVYCWNIASGELVNIWQAHFKTVTRLYISKNGQFCISASEDGMGRAWDMSKVLDVSERIKNLGGKQTITPYRSWSSHTLAIKDMFVVDSPGLLRVFTCSSDRTVVLYDVHAGKQVLRVSLPHSLESLVLNPGEDLLCVGATNGTIFMVDLGVTAIGVSASHSQIGYLDGGDGSKSYTSALSGMSGSKAAASSNGAVAGRPAANTVSAGGLPAGASILEGHTKSVTALCFSVDNTTLVSTSEDGTVRFWDAWTRQCVRECKPLNKCSITNAIVLSRPEILGTGVVKPSLCPVAHLKKYVETSSSQLPDSNGNPKIELGATLLTSHDLQRDSQQDIPTREFLQLRRKQMGSSSVAANQSVEFEHVPESSATPSSAADKKRKRGDAPAASASLEDFVSFSSAYDATEHQHSFSDDEEQEESSASRQQSADLEQRLREAEEKVALLTQSNGRLEDMCGRFRAIIERKTPASVVSTHQTVDQDQEDEETEKDAGDAAEVVHQILSANSSSASKGKKDKTGTKTPVKTAVVVIEEQAAPSTGGKKRKLPVAEEKVAPVATGKTPVKASKKK